MKVYNGTFSSENTFTYTLQNKGSYRASVTVVDNENNRSILYSDNVICVGEKHDHMNNNNTEDVILSLQIFAENIDNLTGKNFVCSGFDKNGLLTTPINGNNPEEPII